MRRLRFFCETIDNQSILDPVESNHLSRVMRVQVGQMVELFDGKGMLAEGTVDQINKKQTVIKVHKTELSPSTGAGSVILAVSFAKGQRFDWMVEKCTELGIDHIAAVQFERTVKLGKDTALERYRKISIAAAKQSGRLFLPEFTGPAKLPQTLDMLNNQYPGAAWLFGDPKGGAVDKLATIPNQQHRIVVIGPEGGLSEDESALLKTMGALGVSINRNILRIETAAIAFCAILNAARF